MENKKRILLIEDEVEILELLTMMLRPYYDVVACPHYMMGVQQIAAADAHFDLVITDFNNGVAGGGAKIVETTRKCLPGVPVLVISGTMEDDDVKNVCRADDYAAKPLEILKLADKAAVLILEAAQQHAAAAA